MASKFWFVTQSQPKIDDSGSITSEELVPIYKFLQFKQLGISQSESKSLSEIINEELGELEPHQDFDIRQELSRHYFTCKLKRNYFISTGKDRNLFLGVQESSILGCCSNGFQKIVIFDLDQKPMFEINQVECSGFISKKSCFAVSAVRSKLIGEISRIDDFLEKPKYEISIHGDLLFTMQSENSSKDQYYVLGKNGKMAFIQEKNKIHKLRIYQMLTVIEKFLLLSLIIILDLLNKAE